MSDSSQQPELPRHNELKDKDLVMQQIHDEKRQEELSRKKSKPKFMSFISRIFNKKSEPSISKPQNPRNVDHVFVDIHSKTGLSGLPPEWESVLKTSDIPKEEVVQNGSAMVDVLRFHFNGVDNLFDSIPRSSLSDIQNSEIVLQDKDPSLSYQGLNKILGQGAYSTVYKATQKSTGKLVAIKVCLEKNYHYIQHEIELQSQSHHPCILTIYECFRWKEHIYIVIEYMDRGSLTEIISPRYPLPEQHIAYVCRCLLLALDALHSKNRIHRDIKSDNILIDSQGHVKLADFGFAVYLRKNDDTRKSIVGTPFWMAPEVIHGNDYGVSADVWSAGITALEMAEGEPPYFHDPPVKALLKIYSHPAPQLRDPDKWSNKFKSFLRMALQKDPEKRATVKELLMHPFMQEASTPEVFAAYIDTALLRRNKKE
ncbi:hypothetical protein WA577_003299 [Blastocystis sp. JDR]